MEATEQKPRDPRWDLAKKLGVLSLAVLAVAVHVMTSSAHPAVRELSLVAAVALLVHFLERFFLWESVRQLVTYTVETVVRTSQEQATLNVTEAVTTRINALAQRNARSLNSIARRVNELVDGAGKCGLVAIYPNRRSVPSNEVRDAIRQSDRVWMLGVALSEEIGLDDTLVRSLKDKIEREGKAQGETRNQVRILLADPLRSPAVFRTFLESPTPVLGRIVGIGHQPPDLHHLANQRLFSDANRTFGRLDNYGETFKRAVKFYAHSPSCWMILLDTVAYFQPYTFGRSLKPGRDSLGPWMPVFKFQRSPGTEIFDILADHIEKMWITTDVDLFHYAAREKDKEAILEGVFRVRRPWLQRVHKVLELERQDSPDRRAYPRQICRSDPATKLTILWQQERCPAAVVRDFSRVAISLVVRRGQSVPPVGQQVRFEWESQAAGIEISDFAQFMIHRFTRSDFIRAGHDNEEGQDLVLGFVEVPRREDANVPGIPDALPNTPVGLHSA